MAEIAHHGVWQVEVARGGHGIHIDRRTALDALGDVEANLADRECLADQVELAPGGPAGDMQVAAKAQGIDGLAREIFERGDTCQVDDRDDLFGDIRKAVIAAHQHSWRSLQFLCAVVLEEGLDGRTSRRRFKVGTHDLGAVVTDRQEVGGVVEACAERGQPLVPHQHQEEGLRKVFWVGRIKTARAVLDGVAAIARQRLGPAQGDRGQPLGGEALDRIAVDALDAGAFAHAACVLTRVHIADEVTARASASVPPIRRRSWVRWPTDQPSPVWPPHTRLRTPTKLCPSVSVERVVAKPVMQLLGDQSCASSGAIRLSNDPNEPRRTRVTSASSAPFGCLAFHLSTP